MTLQSDKYKVGTFLLISGFLFVVFLAFVVGKALFRDDMNYVIRFRESVKGLAVGAKVNYHGVHIGNVKAIRLIGDLTEVNIRTDPFRGKVQKDVTRAFLERNPVTGLATIELVGFRMGTPQLEDGRVIQADLSFGAEMMGTFPDMIREVQPTLKSIKDAATSVQNILNKDVRDKLLGVMTNLNRVTVDLPIALKQINEKSAMTLHSIQKVADKLSSAIDELTKMLKTVSSGVNQTLATSRDMLKEAEKTFSSAGSFLRDPSLIETIQSIKESAKGFEKTLARLRESMNQLEGPLAGSIQSMTPMFDRLSAAAESLFKLTELWSKNPSSIIWAEPGKERSVPGRAPKREQGGRRK